MNILFVSDHYLPVVNGVVKQMVTIKEELEHRGHKVIIVAPKYDRKSKRSEQIENVFYLPSMPFFLRPQDRLSLPFYSKIVKKLLDMDIDIIHSHGFLSSSLGMKIANEKGIPIVVTLHTSIQEYTRWLLPWAKSITPPITNWITQLYFNQFDTVIAPSIKAVKNLKKSKVTAPIALMHNGIDIDHIRKVGPEAFREKYGIAHATPLVIIVGRIDYGKNVHLAVKAMKKVVNVVPDAKLAIIGDGELRKKMVSLIKKLKLQDSVFITGFIEHDMVLSATQAATISLMTSDSDTLPTVAIEAISCGKPMVAVQDDAITAIIRHGENGLLTAKDVNEIAAAIIRLLKNKKLRENYSKSCLKKCGQFSIRSYVNELELLYKNLIANHERPPL
jgi:1,2-diacylglycerol 3-alpha-glucosyltransferase